MERETKVKKILTKMLSTAILIIMSAEAILPTISLAVESDNYIITKKYEQAAKEFTKTYVNKNGIEEKECEVMENGVKVGETDKIKTGMQFNVKGKIYEIVVRGDINCDGKLTATDLSQFKKHETKLEILTGARLKATDINNDGKTTVVDRSQLKMLLVGLPLKGDEDGEEKEEIKGNIVVKVETTDPAKEVKVEIEWPEGSNGYNKEISTDGGKTFKPYEGPVTVGENTTIIAKVTDENGETIKEVSHVISNIDKSAPKPYEITVTVTKTSITIEGTTTDTSVDINGNEVEKGIAKYMYKLEGGEWQEENTFGGLKPNTEYKVYAKAIDFAGNETEATNSGVTVKTEGLPKTSEHITIEHSKEEPTNEKVTITFKKDEEVENMEIEYQVGGTDGEWKKGDKCEVEENEDIYVRLVDPETGEIGEFVKVEVNNIDKVAPEAFRLEAESTTNSITISGETTDRASEGAREGIAGIRGYQYKLDNGEWSEETLDTTYTFTNLIQGTEHTVSMRAIDNAGNIKEATNKNEEVTVARISSGEANIEYSINPIKPTREDVEVTLSTTTNYTIEYRIGEGKWEEYKGEILISENGELSARLKDEIDQTGSTKTINIRNIDKIAPNDFELVATETISSITVTANGIITDEASEGAASDIAGIRGYQYRIDDGDWLEETTEKSYTFSNLKPESTHIVSMRVIDKAGNKKEASNKDISVELKEATLANLVEDEIIKNKDWVNYPSATYTEGWQILKATESEITIISYGNVASHTLRR